MYSLLAILIVAIILLDLAAIIMIANEEILYEPTEKFWRIVFVLFVPILGAVMMLSILSTGSKPNNNHMNNSDDPGTYECFHHDSGGGF